MKIDQIVYFPTLVIDKDNSTQSGEIFEARIISFPNDNTVKIEVDFKKEKQITVVPRINVCEDYKKADKKMYFLHHFSERKKLRKDVGGNEQFMPLILSELKNVFPSGNPMRFGEPKIAYGAQTNTWGKKDNAQKIIQNIGSVFEEIHILINILYVLSFGNDYTKKIIGKYIILELNTLFSLFKKLCKHDKNYHTNVFPDLESGIKKLEEELNIKFIRDKFAAHRDTDISLFDIYHMWQKITRQNIFKYVELFQNHLEKLPQNYHFEKRMYFNKYDRHLGDDILDTTDNEHYEPFD